LSLPYVGVRKLSDEMGLTTESLILKKLNEDHLSEAIRIISTSRVPEKYKIGDGTKSFSIRHLLKAAKRYGLYEEVCRYFSLDPFSFENNADFKVCVQLASDILIYISCRVQLTEQDFEEMSFATAMYFKDTRFGASLIQANSIPEMYELFLNGVNHVEDNWSYTLQKADDQIIIIRSFPTERLSDIYKRKDYTSVTTSKFRVAMAAHLVRYQGFTGTKTMISKSIHHGDDYCQFEIDVSNLHPLIA